jgi:hypothetical protein
VSKRKSLPAALTAALALGFVATIFALEGDPGFGAVRLGPWTSWPRLGASDIDPYARAIVAVDGALPLGAGEGMVFYAHADESGAPLDSRCDYEIAGAALPARFWTLTAYDMDGRLRPNPAGRYGLTSAGLLRAVDGAFVLVAAREARAGNWLPLGEKSRFILALRAYEASSGAIGDTYEGLVLPRIKRGECS